MTSSADSITIHTSNPAKKEWGNKWSWPHMKSKSSISVKTNTRKEEKREYISPTNYFKVISKNNFHCLSLIRQVPLSYPGHQLIILFGNVDNHK